MHFLQAINSDPSVLIVCNKTGGTIKGDKKKLAILLHILCHHTLADSCQNFYMAGQQRFYKAFRLPNFNPSM